MDFDYFLGIQEIDAQHDEIFAHLQALQQLISDQEQRHSAAPMLQQLKDLLVDHFAREESFMNVVACTDQPTHRMKHQEMLRLLESCIASLPSSGSAEGVGTMINDTLRAHVLEFDTQIADAIKQLFDTLRAHEVTGRKA